MNKEQILQEMDKAFREDRERFFKVADSMSFQAKYDTHKEEIEELKQKFRDAPQKEGYPNINHPMVMPYWFPKVNFASSWEKDIFIEEQLRMNEEENNEEESNEENDTN